ncbi:MAG TPA: DUF697 domain-containing protein [Phaeodactylibacter sp.]|nr:DUF697 domain-containing protein [Phaeodactylibacter sp.]
MSDKKIKAESIIRNHVMFATGAGAIPIPLLDFAGVTAVQVDMLKGLTNLYGKNHDENVGKAFIASLSTTSLARMGASMIKAIPGVGTVLGGFSMSIMSGASTYALGNVIMHFMERGIGLEDIDEELAKKIYEEELEKGKKVAEELRNQNGNQNQNRNQNQNTSASENATPPPPPPPKVEVENDIYAELLKLGELREKNIITEDEFSKMKKDIIDRF